MLQENDRPSSARGGSKPSGLRPRPAGFTLLEVVAAVCLVAAAGVVASGAARTMLQLGAAAHSEAVGLGAAAEKLEELIAAPQGGRAPGNDVLTVDGVDVTRIWRVRPGEPAAGLSRLEVTARWSHPSLTLLTLVTVAP
jgi:type II secretory pathway pseudopilin PulG